VWFTDRNYLLVLTDGYLDFEDYRNRRQVGHRYASTQFVHTLAGKREQWEAVFKKQDYGILSLKDKNFCQLNVLILEVTPHADYHFEILEAVWRKWLNESHTKTVKLLLKGNLATSREYLSRFLQQ
jgi:hypothetical protein